MLPLVAAIGGEKGLAANTGNEWLFTAKMPKRKV